VIGRTVGSYRVVSELGKGGMGVVYRAEHLQLGRPAAIKMLLPSLSSDPAIVQRFFNEARAASAIDHPGIVEIYDYGTHADGSAFIIMALLRGESLEQRLARGPLTTADAANIAAQVAGALAAAHARGIVHRDLKPDNIFLVPNDLMPGGVQVKLLDFGIAKLADERSSGVKTQTGALLGTPAYMSPEQCMGRSDIDHRTDLYSLGCILFHLCCGRPPFLSEHGTGMMIAAHIRDPAPPPQSINPAVPDAMAAIITRLLEKDPAARFQSATELREALIAVAGLPAAVTSPAYALQFAPTMAGGSLTPPVNLAAGTAAAGAAATVAAGTAGATPAPANPSLTTRGGAAAEVVAPATAVPPKRRTGLLIGAGVVVFAGAAAGGYLLTRDRGGEGTTVAAAEPSVEQPPAAPPETPAIAPPEKPAAAPPEKPAVTPPEAPAIAPPEKPAIAPPEKPAAPEEPVVAPDKPEKPVAPDKPEKPVTPDRPRSVPAFHLASPTVEPGGDIEIRFDKPVPSPPDRRTWVTVVEAGRSSTAFGAWTFVNDKATRATLKAPTKLGAYEVRLHTDYPARATHVVGVARLEVGAPAETPASEQRFTLPRTKVTPNETVAIRFPVPMIPAQGERFWVTIVPVDKSDSEWGSWKYVDARATRASMEAPTTPGDYEVRLHAHYPRKTTDVVHRERITVEAPPAP